MGSSGRRRRGICRSSINSGNSGISRFSCSVSVRFQNVGGVLSRWRRGRGRSSSRNKGRCVDANAVNSTTSSSVFVVCCSRDLRR